LSCVVFIGDFSGKCAGFVRFYEKQPCQGRITGICNFTVTGADLEPALRGDQIEPTSAPEVLWNFGCILGRGIPIMIHGESGADKKMFAKVFHNSGPRADGPFVALNCASIPERLIESELFGYQGGAFTGARKEGSPGKIQQAHGGTFIALLDDNEETVGESHLPEDLFEMPLAPSGEDHQPQWAAARQLGISRNTLYRKLGRL